MRRFLACLLLILFIAPILVLAEAWIKVEDGSGTVQVEQRSGLGYDVPAPGTSPAPIPPAPDYGPWPDNDPPLHGGTEVTRPAQERLEVPPEAELVDHGSGRASISGGDRLDAPPGAEIIDRGTGAPP